MKNLVLPALTEIIYGRMKDVMAKPNAGTEVMRFAVVCLILDGIYSKYHLILILHFIIHYHLI